MKSLKIVDLHKKYGEKVVFDGINFEVKQGEFLSILGASGCGKTTLLRMLIGIESVDSGKIMKDTKNITNLAPSERGMGMVFQNYALFPNKTVLENVKYALEINPKTKATAEKTAMKFIKKVGMEEHINKKPNELSGGQQQRVAIARTLALKPNIILFDEPMSALDAENRLILRREFKEIQKEFNLTMIYITHDQEEAFSMSDRIMVLNKGKIEQIDEPSIIYNKPASKYVETFVRDHLREKVASIEKNTVMKNGK